MSDGRPGVKVFDARCSQPIGVAASADELWRIMKRLRSRGCPQCGWEIELLAVDVETLCGYRDAGAADELPVPGLPAGDVQPDRHRGRVLPLLRVVGRAERVRARHPDPRS